MNAPAARSNGQDKKIRAFAERLEAEYRTRIACDYPRIDLSGDLYRVRVIGGRKYTRVDVDGSGKYMIVNATGEIYGIAGYGKIHFRHAYGTLDTIDEWDWGGYVAVPKRLTRQGA